MADQDEPPSTKTVFPFFKLPQELRDSTYEEAVHDELPIMLTYHGTPERPDGTEVPELACVDKRYQLDATAKTVRIKALCLVNRQFAHEYKKHVQAAKECVIKDFTGMNYDYFTPYRPVTPALPIPLLDLQKLEVHAFIWGHFAERLWELFAVYKKWVSDMTSQMQPKLNNSGPGAAHVHFYVQSRIVNSPLKSRDEYQILVEDFAEHVERAASVQVWQTKDGSAESQIQQDGPRWISSSRPLTHYWGFKRFLHQRYKDPDCISRSATQRANWVSSRRVKEISSRSSRLFLCREGSWKGFMQGGYSPDARW